LGWRETGRSSSESTDGGARWTLLCLSSRDGGVVDSDCRLDSSVEAPTQCSFDRSPDVAVRLALGGASDLIGAGLGMASHPSDRDGVQRSVQRAVAATVEAMPRALTAARLDGRDASERGEGGLVADPTSGATS